MPWAFKILNTFGTTLIDDKFASMCLRANGSIQTQGDWGESSAQIGYTPSASAMLAVSCPSMCTSTMSGGVVTIRSSTPAQARFYVFDEPPAPAPGWGMVVKSETGKVTFDSRHKYATVAAIRSGRTFTEWQGSQALPAGRSYAVAMLRPAETHVVTWVHIGDPQLSEYRYTDNMTYSVFSVNGSTIQYAMGAPTIGVKELFITGTSGSTRTYEDMTAAVIDVTNY